MAWKKIKVRSGDVYILDDCNYKTHLTKNVSIEDLNDINKDFDFTKNPAYITEVIKDIDGVELPNGVYVLRADDIFDEPKLYPLIPSHDKFLLELDVVKDVLQDFRSFIEAEEVYRKLGLLHKRGALLYGPPGTGKTTCIQMIIGQIRPEESLVIYITKEIPSTFVKAFKDDKRLKIIIFEELAATINNTNMSRFLTFLDGENSLDNCYILATTNYPESLPGNIVDRPGRFDKLYPIDTLSTKDRATYLRHLLGRTPTEEEIMITNGMSIATIKEILLMIIRDSLTARQASDRIKLQRAVVKKNFKKSNDIGFSSDDD